jgi:hypothetical protein
MVAVEISLSAAKQRLRRAHRAGARQMHRFFRRGRIGAVLFGLSIVAAISAVAQAPTPRAGTEQSGKSLKKDQDAANSRLLAAAEPFEVLTEQAFSATSSKLQNLVNEVETAAQKVNALLPADAQSALDKQLSAIKQAQNPSELALAAVEGYRILVSLPQDTKIPTAVSLLDYAGFRYNANLKSNPTRWTDMQNAVEFAQEQWRSISGQVSRASLQKSFSSALTRMGQAVANKSAKAAASAVKDEQDLVDKLEVYFRKK